MHTSTASIAKNTLIACFVFYLIGISTYELQRFSYLYENVYYQYRILSSIVAILVTFAFVIYLFKVQNDYLETYTALLDAKNKYLSRISHKRYSVIILLLSINFYIFFQLNLNLALYSFNKNYPETNAFFLSLISSNTNLRTLILLFVIIIGCMITKRSSGIIYILYNLIFASSYIYYWFYYLSKVNLLDNNIHNAMESNLFWWPILLFTVLLVGNILWSLTSRLGNINCLSDWNCYKLNYADMLLSYRTLSLLPVFICFQWGLLRL